MRFYIVDYKGDVLGDFGSYTAAKLHLKNYEREFIKEMELEIIQDDEHSCQMMLKMVGGSNNEM